LKVEVEVGLGLIQITNIWFNNRGPSKCWVTNVQLKLKVEAGLNF